MLENLIGEFKKVYGSKEDVCSFFAPGRVNLIGEHIDYNGGHVFPCALSLGTYALVRKRKDSQIRVFSKNFSEIGVIRSDLSTIQYEESNDWANYPLGVIDILQKENYRIDHGMDILFNGNIPNGAGLSSSASVELVMGVALNNLFQLNIDQVDLVKYCQRAENEFIGVSCGIMDQFSIGLAKQDHAILLNCQTLDYQQTPIQLDEEVLIIANSNKRRGLADSKYNERRAECEQALADLKETLDIHSLGDLSIDEFENNKHLIKNTTELKRAKHAVYENQRTIEAVHRLNNGDLIGFGQLMNESHVSLRDDYEVTGKELDALVEAAWEEGAIGARMTGAGFGGCTINIVKKTEEDHFIQKVGKRYKDKVGLTADFYVVEIGDGAKQLEGGEKVWQ
ncbi:galactokinase [Halobacillus amylolyticus]|uniref:Galactokinase n=1 Tax=Halobacillus amylolyticus TaxID=2932259 RepID=A0ABY4HA87_9BACI|nr:galactokinase [Halobacillus amylolyticus]UOR11597.1 galactokinase [Halobacillus amylolyticus]